MKRISNACTAPCVRSLRPRIEEKRPLIQKVSGLAASIGGRAVTDFPKIGEIVVPANMEAVNAAVAEHRIEPDQIISGIVRPQRVLAIGDYEEKYRIIYSAR